MNPINDATVLELLERVRNRYYGKYRGTCVAVDESTLRIKAKVPAAEYQVSRKIDEAKQSGRKSILLLVERQGDLRFVALRLDQG